MTSQEKRRQEHITVMHIARMSELATMEVDSEWASEQRNEMAEWYDALLAYFDEREKPVADAIRYGLRRHSCKPKPSYGVHSMVVASYDVNSPSTDESTW